VKINPIQIQKGVPNRNRNSLVVYGSHTIGAQGRKDSSARSTRFGVLQAMAAVYLS